MKYAVTGANGLIGKFLAMQLAEDGHDVVAICRSSTPKAFGSYSNLSVLKGDIEDASFLKTAFENVDGVFHVAAFAKPWAKNKEIYYRINEQGTRNVCEAALAGGVKRVVYTSSAGTHGPQAGEQLVDENTWPLAYHTDYEQSKFNGKEAALSYTTKGLEVVVVSPARVYAMGEVSESNVPVRMMRMYLKNGFGIVPTDGQGIGSYVFMDDIVHGHVLAMTKAPSGEEYLLGGSNVSYMEFFKTLERVSGKKSPVIKIPYPLSLFIGKSQLFMATTFGLQPKITTPWVRKYLKNWGISSKKIGKLGYRPMSLEEGMKRVIETL